MINQVHVFGFARRSFAIACTVLLLLGSSANAGTILQFTQAFPTDFITATNTGGGTTMLSTINNADGDNVSIPVIITNSYLGLPPFLAYETFINVTSSGAAVNFGGAVLQAYSGTIAFTSGVNDTGINYLTATWGANTGLFSGVNGSTGATLSATPVLTSSFETFIPPMSMALGFSNVALPLAIAGGSVASFTGQNAGTFSAAIVPEPSTLTLSSLAIVIGTLTYGKKRNSRSKA